MHRARQTKIVATLGPASKDRLEELFLAGVDVFRVNFSHTDAATAQYYVDAIRTLEVKHERPIALLADLQGPKLRIGKIEDTLVKMGDTLVFGDGGIDLPHPEIFASIKSGDVILIDDGRLRVTIQENNGKRLTGRAENAHVLMARKGINLPGVILPMPALTEKDKADLNTALALGFDWVALSFVQTAKDVSEARALMDKTTRLMVKLEKPSALTDLENIVALADGVMLARGDLGVEIPIEQVPPTQKRVVHYVRSQAKPVIVATQMLESMITSPFPTRAEASDVATAIYDGADAIMLSGETASGIYPHEAVAMMDRIARTIEADAGYQHTVHQTNWESFEAADIISKAAADVAADSKARFIVSYTSTGGTARLTARQRPPMPILALTPNPNVARQLSLSYGVHPVVIDPPQRLSQLAQFASRVAREQGIGQTGDPFVLTAGTPFGVAGTTNTIRVAEVES
jgi:pyruvate kinase